MSNYKTPLRYPGGKQRLTPFVSEVLLANNIKGNYVEPYAGGSGVAMELLLSGRIDHVHLNDSFLGIYAFWYSVVNHNEALCKLIYKASLTIDEWEYRKNLLKNSTAEVDLLELGFTVFYLNRVNRSGVLNAGVIGGKLQEGNYKMDARFNKIELIHRIEAIGQFSSKINVSNLDAEVYTEQYLPNLPQDTLIYFDPPYYEKGQELYLNAYCKSDHERLSETIQNTVDHKWILSYDGVPNIIELYRDRRHFTYELQYTAAKAYKGCEVFVFSDEVEIPITSKLENVNVGIGNLIHGF